MRSEHRTTDDEYDAFTGWRHVVVRMRRTGVRKAIKQRSHRTDRRRARHLAARPNNLRDLQDIDMTDPSRPTNDDSADMAADHEAFPPRVDEIVEPSEVNPTEPVSAELRALLDETAAESELAYAEADEDDGQPLPDHVTVSRPNRARSRVLEVRLNPEEYEAFEQLARARGLPMSTIARAEVLGLLKKSQRGE